MTRSAKLGLAFAFATSWLSTLAHADIPPPDTCEKAGGACMNAGQAFDQPGTCFERTCTKGPPGEQVTYECLRCEAEGEGGSGGAGGEPGTGGTAGEPAIGGSGGDSAAGASGELPEGGAPNPSTGGGPATGGVAATGGKPTGGEATGGKANAGSPSTPPKSDDDSDDGCSVRGVGAERGFAGLMLLVGLALLGRGRRR
jgi:MYXO-CTERM domain-containing protein